MPLVVNTVCQSNMNRSMAAHLKLQDVQGLQLVSSGVGEKVKIPGDRPDRPNVYDFGTPYSQIEADLRSKDEALYLRNNLIPLVARNKGIKTCPQRFTEVWAGTPCDIIFSFEERVYDTVLEVIQLTESHPAALSRVHVFNLTTNDTKEDAEKGADLSVEFLQDLVDTPDWENHVPELVQRFVDKHRQPLLHCLLVLPDLDPWSQLPRPT
uniref:RNA polymerase II subunit A C-terminal domain phosphatase SSU72 n=1 Tax=Eutreptiella gymnastica TaxID=73025 RepID=A0A7S1NPC6_9EUGL